MTTGTNTTSIEIPFPVGGAPHLRIAATACVLRVEPGDGAAWVEGSYSDPSGTIPLRVERAEDGAELLIGTEVRELVGLLEGPPRLLLRLGGGRPFGLTIEAGACEMQLELGGMPISRLLVSEGAGKTTVAFSTPNPVEMDLLKVAVGAGAIEAHGLANAGFTQMQVEGGAAGVQLAFGGTLRGNAHVSIATALAGVEVDVPADLAAEITWATLLGTPTIDGGFTRVGDAYYTPPALAGHEPAPRLRIHYATGLGGLRLRTLWPADAETESRVEEAVAVLPV